MSNETGQQKKRHKYIDSDEDDQPQQQFIEQQKQSPVVQTITINQKTWNYLFEPDSSEQQQEEKKQKKVSNPQIAKPKQTDQRVKQNKSSTTDIDDLRYEILCRWWYCFDQWPPNDFDYEDALQKYKLRKVDLSVFKREQEINDEGLRKVYEVNGYKGVFRTSAGDTLDLRPKEGCPSYEQVSKINQKLLPKLLIKGLKAQLEDLMKYEPNNKQLRKQLEEQLEIAQKKYRKIQD